MPINYTVSNDIYLASAIRDIILETGITPQTTTSTPVNVGDTTVTLATPEPSFLNGSLLMFQDNLGEEPIPVLGRADTVVTCNFIGMGYDGFQYPHDPNTVVFTNLFVDAPNFIDPMLQLGKPVIFIMAVDEQENLVAMRQVQSTYTFHIEYRRMLATPVGSQINTNIWAFRQEAKARTDLDRIADALRTNPHLTTSRGGMHAESLGDRSNSQAWITKSWVKLVTDEGMQEFIATMQVIVRANRESF